MSEILLKDESYAIVGACFEVYNQIGPGFLEAVYHECLALEFGDRGIPFRSHAHVAVAYKNRTIASHYEADFVCFEQIIVELKAVSSLNEVHEAQLLNYLRATNLPLGLLVNFGSPGQLNYKRLANTSRRGLPNS
jgi:GxxExxY protein